MGITSKNFIVSENNTLERKEKMSIGFTEIILIVLFVLFVFGAKRIPELAKALGRASYEFKKAKRDLQNEGQEMMEAAEKAVEKADKKADEKTDA